MPGLHQPLLLPVDKLLKIDPEVDSEGRYGAAVIQREDNLRGQIECKWVLMQENNRVYILRTEDRKSFNVKFKYEERFHNN